MIINLILLAIFLSSFFIVWCRVSQGIPRLATVSEEAIAAYLKEESSKLHFFVVEIKSFYRDKKYKEWLRVVWAKLLYRFHILLLKVDNKITTILKDLRAIDIKTVENKVESLSIIEIKSEKEVITSPKTHRIQEVRVRKKRSKQKDIQELPS
ncbi:MAG: hypothetical protein Q8R29_02740 [bacterium]|nr:hypothetical protein [bacterium]